MQPFSGRYRGLLIEWCEQWRQGGCNGAYFYRSDGGDFDPSLIQGIRDGRIIYDGSANDALFGPFAAIDSAVADINAFMTETEPKHTSEAIPLMLDALKTVVDWWSNSRAEFGEVSQKVWNSSYEPMKKARAAIAKAEDSNSERED